MGSAGPDHGGMQGDETAKVVRIPRDWFGPDEEFVPIGPPAADPPGPPLDPNAFWDGSSNSIHDVVEGSLDEPSLAPAGARRSRSRVPRFRTRQAVGALLVMMIGAASAIGWILGNGHRATHESTFASVNANPGTAAATLHPRHAASPTRPHPRVPARARRVRRHATVARGSSNPTEVAYRSTAPTQAVPIQVSTPPPSTAVSPTVANSGAAGSGSRIGSVSAASANQPSPTAFGANSALGPMSSPDG